MLHALTLFVLALSCALSAPVFSQTMPEIQLERVHAVRSRTIPEHYMFYGHDKISGNILVVDVNGSQITNPILDRSAYFWNDHGVDAKFENGNWLILTPERTFESAVRQRDLNGLVSPVTGYEPMNTVTVTTQLIDRLKMKPFISKEAYESIKKNQGAEDYEFPMVPGSEPRLMTFEYKTEDRRSEGLDKLRNELYDKLKGKVFYSYDVGYSGKDGAYVIGTFAKYADEVARYVQEKAGYKPEVKFYDLDLIEGASEENKPAGWGIFSHAHTRLNELESKRWKRTGAAAKEAARKELHQMVYDLQFYTSGLIQQPRFSLWRWQDNQTGLATFDEQYLTPALELKERAYAALDQLGTEAARETIMFGSHDSQPSQEFLRRKATGLEITYFQWWMQKLLADMKWFRTATPEQIKEARASSGGGGMLREFGFMSVHYYHIQPTRTAPPYYDMDRATWPLKIFGYGLDQQAKREFIQFLIDADKESEALKQWILVNGDEYTKKYAQGVFGNRVAISVIQSMPYADRTDAKFNAAIYYRQMMSVVTELLNTSTVTITNNGMYMALLDASFGIQRIIREEFPELLENQTVVTELLKMKDATQLRLARGLFVGIEMDYKLESENCISAVLPR
jgi:hypothetical protein